MLIGLEAMAPRCEALAYRLVAVLPCTQCAFTVCGVFASPVTPGTAVPAAGADSVAFSLASPVKRSCQTTTAASQPTHVATVVRTFRSRRRVVIDIMHGKLTHSRTNIRSKRGAWLKLCLKAWAVAALRCSVCTRARAGCPFRAWTAAEVTRWEVYNGEACRYVVVLTFALVVQ